jgi:hypothetical protein
VATGTAIARLEEKTITKEERRRERKEQERSKERNTSSRNTDDDFRKLLPVVP